MKSEIDWAVPIIKIATLPHKHAKRHLAAMTAAISEVKDYGHGIGKSSGGDLTRSGASGGASGADYQPTSVGDTPDADCQGPTWY